MIAFSRASAFVVVSALLAACVSENEPMDRPDPAPSPVADPEPPPVVETPAPPALAKRAPEIDPAQAQAEAVMKQVSFGLDPSTLPTLSVGRLLAEDFEGNPSMYLVFTSADRAVHAPLSFTVATEPSAGDTTTVVGAGSDRPPASLVAPNLQLLASIQRTAAALGGAAKLRRLVAATPSVFLLEAIDGAYWDVETSERVPDEVLIEKRAAIAAAMQSPEAREEVARLRDEWTAHLAEAPATAKPPSSLADEKGDLDLARAFVDAKLGDIASSMRPKVTVIAPKETEETAPFTANAVTAPKEENCRTWWFFGWHRACDIVEEGYIARESRQAHAPYQKRAFSLPRCVVGGKVANVFQGCGPAAMTALVWRSWQNGMDFPSLGSFPRATGSAGKYEPYPYRTGATATFANNMESVLGIAFASEMGTCTPGEAQGLTLPPGFESGANRWLKNEGVPIRLAHATSAPGLHRFDAARKANLLHQLVGLEERPVIALGDVGFVVAHYAPVARYRIVNRTAAFPQVWVKMLGWHDTWVNLHGALQMTSALYWFEKK